jgi:molybdate transport repressor ModE-like protein
MENHVLQFSTPKQICNQAMHVKPPRRRLERMEAAMTKKHLRCQVSVRIFGEVKCFGPGVADLLERVDRLKSLRKATIEMEMAYSKAWKIIKIAEENLGFPLLKSVTGGKGGGGAELTEEAVRFLAAYRRLETAIRSYADEAFVEFMGG